MVRQVADGQRREPAERRRDGQNQQNQKKAFCFRGSRAKMLFQIFGLLHNAHDPFHVAAGNGRPHHSTTFRGS